MQRRSQAGLASAQRVAPSPAMAGGCCQLGSMPGIGRGPRAPLLASAYALRAEGSLRPSTANVMNMRPLAQDLLSTCFQALHPTRMWGRTAMSSPGPGHPVRVSIAEWLGPEERSSPRS